MKYISRAPGKIIITGEHFVVHGGYALVAAINRYVEATAEISDNMEIFSERLDMTISNKTNYMNKLTPLIRAIESLKDLLGTKKNLRINIKSDIPISSGLGSSGSVAVATLAASSAALGHNLSSADLIRSAMVSEKIVHGNPSGVDVTIPVYGGLLLFKKGSPPKPITMEKSLEFVVCMTGMQRDTSKMIEKVSHKMKKYPKIFSALVDSSSHLGHIAAESIGKNDSNTLGSILTFHHIALSWLGASSPECNTLVEETLNLGALGVKVTGGGGGGAIIALSKKNEAKLLTKSIKSLGYDAFVTELPVEGVSVWKKKI